jgi:histone deacetylase 6
MGFSIFNSVAIAARAARDKFGCDRVLIVDWDVHHGNGTQHMFLEDKSVLYFSVHRFDNGDFYPCGTEGCVECVGEGAGEGYNINVPWNLGLEYVSSLVHPRRCCCC